ncbi:MAG: hypothetical protein EZS28_009841 [Streblomastix strix]|uniref:Uncharacterized protein n=1 Tax=Streblomastix strix TaxID=222440 RepID=A0A5J4WI07_9EUKA|nr:MAG: hypothetical protein EZS28_009841 [Streblomastix strix]
MTQRKSPGGTGPISFVTYLKECSIPVIFEQWNALVFIIEGYVTTELEQLISEGKFSHSFDFTPVDECFKGRNDTINIFIAKNHENGEYKLQVLNKLPPFTRIQIFVQPLFIDISKLPNQTELFVHNFELRHFHIPDSNKTAKPTEAYQINSIVKQGPPQQGIKSVGPENAAKLFNQQPVANTYQPQPAPRSSFGPIPKVNNVQQTPQHYAPPVVPDQAIYLIGPTGDIGDLKTNPRVNPKAAAIPTVGQQSQIQPGQNINQLRTQQGLAAAGGGQQFIYMQNQFPQPQVPGKKN